MRREDLYNSSSDEEAPHDYQWDSSLQEKLNLQFSDLLDLDLVADANLGARQAPQSQVVLDDANQTLADDGATEKPEEEIFTFRLFRDEEPLRKVVLKLRENEKDGEGAFVVPSRPTSYFLAEELSSRAKEFQVAAVSANYLLEDATKRRWGLEKPWRVKTISIKTSKRNGTPTRSDSRTTTTETGKQKRKRPGKKRRIILRVREKAKKEQLEAMRQQLVEREQHIKDKKQRLNRQKKLKRRAKEREKKQGTTDDAEPKQSDRDSSL